MGCDQNEFSSEVYETVLPIILEEMAFENEHHGRLHEAMDELYK